MKKYFLLLALLPFSANGAFARFSFKNFGNIVRVLSQQRSFLSRSSMQSLPVPYTSPEECLKQIILQDLDEQGIPLSDIHPNNEEALNLCIEGLIKTAYQYKKTKKVSVYYEWHMSNHTLEAAIECLRFLEK